MFDLEIAGDGTLRLTGRLDAVAAEAARPAFVALDGAVTVDCSGLEYISSAGIAVLLETYKRLLASGHELKLVRMQPRVRNIFAYAGLDRLLHIE